MDQKRFLSLLLALVMALSLCVTAAADGTGSKFEDFQPRALRAGETLLRGIDVSEHQKQIDWKAVADSGVQFAIIRVAWRGWGAAGKLVKDLTFQENLKGAHDNGLLVGAYIYSQATTPAEAREEAQFLASLVQGYQIDLPLTFDQEFAESGGSYVGRLYNAQLSRQEMTDLCNEFCAEVERLGYASMVYSNPYTLNNHLYVDQLPRLWVAHFVTQTSYAADYEFWQCSSTGSVPGIQTDVDLDFWFAPPEAPKPIMTFTDVPAKHWAYRYLRTAVSKGWIKGYPDNTFRPNETLTRADFVTMLARLSGETLPDNSYRPFSDVQEKRYFTASVAWAVNNGIVSGFPDGTFRPDDTITREQMAHIMGNYLRHLGVDVTVFDPAVDEKITDLSAIGKWAVNDVRFCYAVGLLNGTKKGFEPAGTATRAEAGTVLTRLYRFNEAGAEQTQPDPGTTPAPDPGYGVVLSVPELHIAG